MHACYEAHLAPYRKSPKRASIPPGEEWSRLSAGSLRLGLKLSSAGFLLECRHEGGTGDVAALLDAFCALAEGLPAVEARDHGLLHLEHSLRSPEGEPPVPGLVTPENADPAFAALVPLIRLIPKAGPAHWSPPPSKEWRTLSLADRHFVLLSAVQAELKELGYEGPEIEVVPTSGADRWLLGFGGKESPPGFYRLLLTLERRVRAATETYVELFLEGKEDRNQRRARETRSHDLHPGA